MTKNESPSKKRKVSDVYSETTTKDPTPAEAAKDEFETVSKSEAKREQMKAGNGLTDWTLIEKEESPESTKEDDNAFPDLNEYVEVEKPEPWTKDGDKKKDGAKK